MQVGRELIALSTPRQGRSRLFVNGVFEFACIL